MCASSSFSVNACEHSGHSFIRCFLPELGAAGDTAPAPTFRVLGAAGVLVPPRPAAAEAEAVTVVAAAEAGTAARTGLGTAGVSVAPNALAGAALAGVGAGFGARTAAVAFVEWCVCACLGFLVLPASAVLPPDTPDAVGAGMPVARTGAQGRGGRSVPRAAMTTAAVRRGTSARAAAAGDSLSTCARLHSGARPPQSCGRLTASSFGAVVCSHACIVLHTPSNSCMCAGYTWSPIRLHTLSAVSTRDTIPSLIHSLTNVFFFFVCVCVLFLCVFNEISLFLSFFVSDP